MFIMKHRAPGLFHGELLRNARVSRPRCGTVRIKVRNTLGFSGETLFDSQERTKLTCTRQQ